LEFKSLGYALLSFGYILLTSGGAVIGALYFNHPAEGVILGQAMGAGLIDIIGIIVLWKRFKVGFHFRTFKSMVRFSLPLVPASFLLLGGQQLPKLILSVYGNLEDVGIYGLAVQIAGFAGLAVLGVQTAITPAVLVNHHKDETPGMLGKLFENFTTVSLMFCTFLSVFAKELILVFSTPAYARAANYVPLIAFSIALNSMYIFFPGKIIRGKSIAQLLASSGGFLAAVISGLILIKIDGIRGAAISTLFSAISFFFIWYKISQQLYYLPVNWFKISKSILLSIVVCCIGFFLISSGINFFSIALKCLILMLFTFLIARGNITKLWDRYGKGYKFLNSLNAGKSRSSYDKK
ncbi:MAG: oligosaccharide flippase family protein, partial [Ferruginibacter sp.]